MKHFSKTKSGTSISNDAGADLHSFAEVWTLSRQWLLNILLNAF